jgi:hypothetical protein
MIDSVILRYIREFWPAIGYYYLQHLTIMQNIIKGGSAPVPNEGTHKSSQKGVFFKLRWL